MPQDQILAATLLKHYFGNSEYRLIIVRIPYCYPEPMALEWPWDEAEPIIRSNGLPDLEDDRRIALTMPNTKAEAAFEVWNGKRYTGVAWSWQEHVELKKSDAKLNE